MIYTTDVRSAGYDPDTGETTEWQCGPEVTRVEFEGSIDDLVAADQEAFSTYEESTRAGIYGLPPWATEPRLFVSSGGSSVASLYFLGDK